MKMKNYTKIPNEILEKSQLSIPARLLFCILLKHCGNKDTCFPGQIRLAYSLGYSERHIRNLISELVEAKMVVVKRLGFNKSNTYKVSRDLYRNSGSSHLGSAVPLTNGDTVPNNSTHIKEKDKNYFKNRAKLEKMRRELIKNNTILSSKNGGNTH